MTNYLLKIQKVPYSPPYFNGVSLQDFPQRLQDFQNYIIESNRIMYEETYLFEFSRELPLTEEFIRVQILLALKNSSFSENEFLEKFKKDLTFSYIFQENMVKGKLTLNYYEEYVWYITKKLEGDFSAYLTHMDFGVREAAKKYQIQ